MSQVFISYSGENKFEAQLLKFALEKILEDLGTSAWIFQYDQDTAERNIAGSLKERLRSSSAMIFLVSPYTLEGGATQWMELAYADAFDVPFFVLLHHLRYRDLASQDSGVPPLLLAGECNAATEWCRVMKSIRDRIK